MSAGQALELVVTDLDGTLWDADERMHERTLEALTELRRRRIPLLVATGRRTRSAAAGLARCGLAPPAVLLDGALGRELPDGRVFHERLFAPADAAAVLDAFEDHGLSPCVYVDHPRVDVFVGERPATDPAHLAYLGRWLARGDLRRVVAEERVYGIGLTAAEPDAFAGLERAFEPRFEVTVNRNFTVGGVRLGVNLRVVPPAVSKWAGVLAFCRDQRLDPGRVLAVGDGENDLELLRGARVSCVVSDGCDAALALADHVLGRTDRGGWSEILPLLR